MRRIVVATRSAHKLAELRALLDLPRTTLLSLDEVGLEAPEPLEDGATFEANARLKADYYARRTALPVLADDSGLEVQALEGGPGVRTRRYAGDDATDAANNTKLLRALGDLPPERRGARYVCVLAFQERPAGRPIMMRGEFEGRIASVARGSGGFGYDPIFEPAAEPPGGRTVGQLSAAEKNAVSHRAIAAHAMGEALRRLGY
ncbi:MAG: non-canonical purine NTP pyrophosphatase [Candidatus Limnocylindrales bacterium]